MYQNRKPNEMTTAKCGSLIRNSRATRAFPMEIDVAHHRKIRVLPAGPRRYAKVYHDHPPPHIQTTSTEGAGATRCVLSVIPPTGSEIGRERTGWREEFNDANLSPRCRLPSVIGEDKIRVNSVNGFTMGISFRALRA
ncbi:hypothetical protein F511_30356 [Dorcoceras hygrometricum]|uniref:Uncharacterized protein n=1 Tax=Dorcoceras hygrometricum TaxID=472368 RepID=A0A2Z7CDA8_9LAMI|nr:hypothetical protein F511_30356 [Dorcoceras hygrometricum]